MNSIKLPQMAWHETSKLELPLPDSWQVEICNMAGYDRPALKPEEIREAIRSPIGMVPVRELARGKKEVVIVFDDMSRITRVAGIVPSILEELAEAGISDKNIRFICALGCHGALTRIDFAKKLGEETLARFPVFNHNPFGNCTYVGKTATFGTDVYVNEEVMKCDLKIAIGSVVPHPMNGFGGAGKIILPGVTSFDTIVQNHQSFRECMMESREKPISGMGVFDDNPMRFDVEEAAILTGLDVLVNCIVNSWGETVAVFAGALKPSYTAAVEQAKVHYLTPNIEEKNVVIANGFIKSNEAFIGLGIAYRTVNHKNGDVVLIANNPEGMVTHYLMGPFGTTGKAVMGRPARIPEHVNHLIVYTEYPDLGSRGWFGESDKLMFIHKWDEVLSVLQQSHGADTKVAVYPNPEIQYQVTEREPLTNGNI